MTAAPPPHRRSTGAIRKLSSGRHQARYTGPDGLSWHDQRHSAMTMVAATEATLLELMRRAGHASAGTALRYQDAAEGTERRIADHLHETLRQRPRST